MNQIFIVANAGRHRRSRAWLYDGQRWLRPHEVKLTMEREPAETTLSPPFNSNPCKTFKAGLSSCWVQWSYRDNRPHGEVITSAPVELHTRPGLNIWIINR